MRSTRVLVLALALAATAAACGGTSNPEPATPTAPAAAKVLVLTDDAGVAVAGHDPVAYATDSKAVPGVEAHVSTHQGATYRFASAEHKATFDADPDKHAPRYGGYCAYAASQGRLSPVEPDQFQVLDGQLLLFTNAEFKALFNQDAAGHKAKADANWPALVSQHGKPAR